MRKTISTLWPCYNVMRRVPNWLGVASYLGLTVIYDRWVTHHCPALIHVGSTDGTNATSLMGVTLVLSCGLQLRERERQRTYQRRWTASENDKDVSTLITGNSLRVHVFLARVAYWKLEVLPRMPTNQMRALPGHALLAGLCGYIRRVKLSECHSGWV